MKTTLLVSLQHFSPEIVSRIDEIHWAFLSQSNEVLHYSKINSKIDIKNYYSINYSLRMIIEGRSNKSMSAIINHLHVAIYNADLLLNAMTVKDGATYCKLVSSIYKSLQNLRLVNELLTWSIS